MRRRAGNRAHAGHKPPQSRGIRGSQRDRYWAGEFAHEDKGARGDLSAHQSVLTIALRGRHTFPLPFEQSALAEPEGVCAPEAIQCTP